MTQQFPEGTRFSDPNNPDTGTFVNLGQSFRTAQDNINRDNEEKYGKVQAVRLQGLDEFKRMVAAGFPPTDALAKTAPALFYEGDARATDNAINIPQRPGGSSVPSQPFVPQKIEQDGNKLWQLGPNRWQLEKETMPPDAKAGQEILDQKIREIHKLIQRDSDINAKPGTEMDEKVQAQLRMDQNMQELARLEESYQKGSTNWQHRSSAPVIPPQPAKMKILDESDRSGVFMRRVPDASPDGPRETEVNNDKSGMSMRQVPKLPPPIESVKTAAKESPDDIRAQYRAGKLTRSEAEKKLKQLGFE